MYNNIMTKVKKLLAFLFIASILVGVSYLIVFKVSFLPNGYEIEAKQKDSVSLISFNLLGNEKEIITQSFSENDAWKIDYIEYEVNRQKDSLWMLFSFVTISIVLFVYKVRNGLKLWKAILESHIIFSALLPLPQLINSLNRIFDLIS
ncbi:hypothetical protein [Bacillus sp. FJAT-49736]|uniref:hypothetical protein n=1 Tax=Bacillus sp. FJAT-49736 TaxID=2833582 RepID=UPI001BCA1A4A|nr:hypothetical protein [Bacillus sp. FJAT-49736]MBS4172805.1 hypothetical protein [Bacillus sp. FJAT-49736]